MAKTDKVPGWSRVKLILQRVLDQPSHERALVLPQLCDDDSGLRAEVQTLLAAHNDAGSFCEQPVTDRPPFDPAERSTLVAGTRLGPYEIVGYVASGGMGDVYRGVDTRLGRTVAIKLLSLRHAHHREIRARFDREAHAVARLNHPHICTLLDVGHTQDRDFLVFEYVEGQTLAHRLVRGPVAVPDLLRIAEEVLSALDHAHRNGVIHRDLKPTNILLTHEGAKVCDFGLAHLKRIGEIPPGPSPPGTETALTSEHEIVGTLQYMSPEQIEGHEADERSDIFSFGAVMYEMATGEKAFTGTSEARLIAAVLTSQPVPAIQRRPLTPPLLDHIIQRCLAKDPAERWQSMNDVQAVVKWIATAMAPPDHRAATRRFRISPYLALGATAGLLLAVAGLLGTRARGRSSESMPPIAVTVPPPDNGRFALTESSTKSAQLAVSPDGRMLAFVASGPDGVSQIWIRRLDSSVARAVAGTADATYPFWSPNSRSLGFFAGRKLYRIDLDGGPARPLADAANGRGGTWNAMNVILFSPGASGVAIFRVNADGSGQAEQTILKPGDISQRWPQFLPDGHHFVFFAKNPREGGEAIYLATLDNNDRTKLVESSYGGIYAPPGHLLYIADGTLMARTLDVEHARLTGEPVPIVPNVGASSNYYGAFSASANGVLAYARNGSAAELAWVDRQGRTLGVAAERAGYVDFKLSGDGRYLAMSRIEPPSGHGDIHVLNLERGGNSRVTSAHETDASPVWSPDGTRLVFRSNRSGPHDLYLISLNSSRSEELLLKSTFAKYPTDWTADGQVVYHADKRTTGWDIWATSADPRSEPRPLVQTGDDEVQGHISRDGRWIVYTWFTSSDTPEVYVKALEGDGSRIQISVHGGSDPHWSADGREIFYIADGMLMSVAVHSSQGSLNLAKPRPLFRIPGFPVAAPFASRYDVDRSGQHFLVLRPLEDPQTLPLNVVVNWTSQSTPH